MGDMLFKPYLACQPRQRAEQAARTRYMQQQAEREGPENDAARAGWLALHGAARMIAAPIAVHTATQLGNL